MDCESIVENLSMKTDQCIETLEKSLKELEELYKTAAMQLGNETEGKLSWWYSNLLCIDEVSYKITALRCWRETYGFFCNIPKDLGSEEGMMELLKRIVDTLKVMKGKFFGIDFM